MTQTFLWTVLPNGVRSDSTGSKLQCSVYVSIRLRSDDGSDFFLQKFPDVAGWPEYLRDTLKLGVEVEGRPAIPASQVSLSLKSLEPPLWHGMFRPAQKVRSYQTEDLRQKLIRSYPADQLRQFVEDLYGQVGSQYGTKPPSAVDLGRELQSIDFRTSLTQPGVDTHTTIPMSARTTRGTMRKDILPALGVKGPIKTSVERDIHALVPHTTGALKTAGMAALKSIVADLQSHGYVRDRRYDPMKVLLQVMIFHSAHAKVMEAHPSGAGPVSTMPQLPSFDFHEALSLLGDHPALLKKLGLVLDLEFALPAGMPAHGVIRVRPEGVPATQTGGIKKKSKVVTTEVETEHISPGTVFSFTQDTFLASPRPGSDLQGKLLNLSDPAKYQIVDLDIDGSALKLMQLTDHLEREGYIPEETNPVLVASAGNDFVTGLDLSSSFKVAGTASTVGLIDPDRATLPALRSAGVAVVKAARDAVVKAAIKTSMAHEEAMIPGATQPSAQSNPDNKLVYADDLVRGYRIDVLDSQVGHWLPLCARTVTYKFLHVPTEGGVTQERQVVIEDEGSVGMGLSEPSDQSTDDLFIHEALFHWTGWSLVAPRPGKVTNDQNNAVSAGNETLDDFGLHISSKAGSTQMQGLPRLRFGRSYRLRARPVDLAGNSLQLNELPPSDLTGATEESTYRRFEPVGSPTVMMATPPLSGESLHLAAVRSNGGVSPEEYASAQNLKVTFPERLVGPPAAMQQMVEYHGMFDGMPDEEAYTLMVDRDRAYAVTDGPAVHNAQGRAMFGMPIITDSSFTIPYLPDPIASGARFTFYDRHGKQVGSSVAPGVYRRHGEAWQNPVPIRVRVVEGTGEPSWKNETLLEVPLPKAEVLTMVYGSIIEGSALEHHGVWMMIARKAGMSASSIKNDALRGDCWMVTPPRTMKLVHAVQQPLVKPTFQKIVPIKQLGDTFATLHGHVIVDGKSSVALEIRATWTDPIDDPATPRPGNVTGQSQIFNHTVGQFDEAYLFGNQSVRPQVVGVQQLVPSSQAAIPGGAHYAPMPKSEVSQFVHQHEDDRRRIVATGIAASEASRAQLSASRISVQKTFSPLFVADEAKRHDIGDTKYHKVTYQAVATSRFREYFTDLVNPPPSGSSEGSHAPTIHASILHRARGQGLSFTQEGTREEKVLNSARPAQPKVLYMMPTFQWEEEKDSFTILRRRCGGGLRVYLDRPWYSSGDEELLGVILRPAGASNAPVGAVAAGGALNPAAEHLVSQWGYDPTWDSLGGLKPSMKLADFRQTAHTGSLLPIAEIDQVRVDVAGYKPVFDEQRKLWYADIVLDPGTAYFPFVKLALARFQPYSVDGAHLSPIVTTEFIQLVPDRVAAVTVDGKGSIIVQVSGPSAMRNQKITDKVSAKTPSRFVTAVLEHAVGTDMTWVPMEEEANAVLDLAEQHESKLIWKRTIPEPEGFSSERGTGTYRLVIREDELFDYPGHDVMGSFNPGRRPVYADAIEL